MKKVFITGGAGYVGSQLVTHLLQYGYYVTVYDLFIYGMDVLDSHPNLCQIKGDIRDLRKLEESLINHNYVIHLACISNDPSFELNPLLGKSINLDSFKPFVELSIKHNISRFIYASSSSVYGVKDSPNVNEGMSLEPLTDYSKYKAECELILEKYTSDSFETVIVRPATVCGFSRRQRLDVVVNILTVQAFYNNKITILGGDQLRPNIHIKDMIESYRVLLDAPKEKVNGQVFNIGFENKTVNQIGNLILLNMKDKVEINIIESNDNRSYHISSDKIKRVLNFTPKHNISDAVNDLIYAFNNKSLTDPLNNELYYNIKRMKNITLV